MVVTSSWPSGDDQRVVQTTMGAQESREHRAGVRHQGDRAGRKRVALQVADRAYATRDVDEPHAPGAADLEAGRGLDNLLADADRAAEDHGPAVSAGRGQGDLFGQPRVGHTEQDQVDGRGHVGEGGQRRMPEHSRPSLVDEVGAVEPAAAEHLGGHPQAQRVGPLAGSHDGDRAGLQHPAYAGTEPGAERDSHCRRSSRRGERRADLASFRAAREACRPGMPQTPPPA